MSVYRRKGSDRWHYDFVLKGRRYCGPTGQTSRRAAETVERAERLKAATGAGDDAGSLTIDMAAGRYFDERGDSVARPDALRRDLLLVVACLGKATQLREITPARIQDALARRRGAGRRAISAATVNRTMIDSTLRPLLNRARKVWGARDLPAIEWKALRLREPKGLVQEYTDAQVGAWLAALPDLRDRLALELMLTYGLRYGELFFSPAAVDGAGRRLTIAKRKAGDTLVLPLTEAHARTLAAMASTVSAGEAVLGVTYAALQRSLRRAAAEAGIDSRRVIHGCRHHAGTRILRETGNLALAKRLLGHASIVSTVRYAHVSDADLRAAIDGISRHSPDADAASSHNPAKTQRNS